MPDETGNPMDIIVHNIHKDYATSSLRVCAECWEHNESFAFTYPDYLFVEQSSPDFVEGLLQQDIATHCLGCIYETAGEPRECYSY